MSGERPPDRTGLVLFWAAVAAFALVDAGGLVGDRLARWITLQTLASALAYVLLAGFALAIAVAAGAIASAFHHRRPPPPWELVRAGVALVLVLGHVALLVFARRHW